MIQKPYFISIRNNFVETSMLMGTYWLVVRRLKVVIDLPYFFARYVTNGPDRLKEINHFQFLYIH